MDKTLTLQAGSTVSQYSFPSLASRRKVKIGRSFGRWSRNAASLCGLNADCRKEGRKEGEVIAVPFPRSLPGANYSLCLTKLLREREREREGEEEATRRGGTWRVKLRDDRRADADANGRRCQIANVKDAQKFFWPGLPVLRGVPRSQGQVIDMLPLL